MQDFEKTLFCENRSYNQKKWDEEVGCCFAHA